MKKQNIPTPFSKLAALITATASLSALLPVANAALLVEESFEYAAGSLGAANGGTGFNTEFRSGGGGAPGTWNPGAAVDFNVIASGLNYTGLESTGGATQFTGANGWSSNARRSFTTIDTTTTQVWGSYLLRVDAVGDDGFELKFGEATNINWGIATGYKREPGNEFQGFSNPTGANPAGPAFTVGDTNLIVWAYNNAGDDGDFLNGDLLIWVNPTLGVAPDILAPTIYVNGGVLGDLGTMQIYGRNTTVTVDEIRLGTDFASVTPVPEPSSYAAIAGVLGLLAVGARRIRRSA